MKYRLFALAVFIAVMPCFAASTDEAQIKSLVKTYQNAINSGDNEAAASCWEDPESMESSLSAINALRTSVPGVTINYILEALNLKIDDPVCTAEIIMTVKYTGNDTAEIEELKTSYPTTFTSTGIFRKGEDGWKIVTLSQDN